MRHFGELTKPKYILDKKTNRIETKSEKLGTFFAILCLIWLIDNTTSLISSSYSYSTILKSEWSKNIEILLALTGIIFGMELRARKIKPLIGITILGIIIITGIILKFADL